MTIINCDMGEGFGLYRIGDDEGLMPLIDVANVACGFHASDFNHMRRTVQLAKQHGVKVALNHIKPHGSLYGMAARMEDVAHAVADVADLFRVPLFGMAGTLHEQVYTARGHAFVSEFYADLDYNDQGGLIITREHAATDPDTASAACIRAMREGKVSSVGGVDVSVRADAICVHSDTPNAVAVAHAVRAAVKAA